MIAQDVTQTAPGCNRCQQQPFAYTGVLPSPVCTSQRNFELPHPTWKDIEARVRQSVLPMIFENFLCRPNFPRAQIPVVIGKAASYKTSTFRPPGQTKSTVPGSNKKLPGSQL